MVNQLNVHPPFCCPEVRTVVYESVGLVSGIASGSVSVDLVVLVRRPSRGRLTVVTA